MQQQPEPLSQTHVPPPLPDEARGTGAGAELAGPVGEAERITSLDLLRGVAVLGILVMNIQSFSMIEAAYFNSDAWGDLSGVNWWVWFVSHVLFEQKFITIFSMLFGAGIVLMSGRQEARGRSPTAVHYRRMGVLLVVGLLHAYLLWHGDVLFFYAVCGMVVYWCRNWRPGWLIGLGLAGVMVGGLLWGLLMWTMPYWPDEARQEFLEYVWPTAEAVEEELAAYRGGWWEQMSHRAPTALSYQVEGLLTYIFWWTGGMMLIGMGLFKLGIMSGTRSTGFYWGMIAVGLVGIVVVVVAALGREAIEGETGLSLGGYNYFASLLVALGWIGVVMLWARGRRQGALAFRDLLSESGREAARSLTLPPPLPGREGGIRRAISAVGRMALTNYLLQTVICTTIFYGHGLGLFGRVERWGQAVIVVGVWGVLIVFSSLWMKHFQNGPVEWVWRASTYRHIPRIRRQAVESTTEASRSVGS
jgi:uncharacterized protein